MEKKLVVTGRQKVRPCVMVHTFVLALANRDCLRDPSGLVVRFVPYHLYLIPVYHMCYDKLLLHEPAHFHQNDTSWRRVDSLSVLKMVSDDVETSATNY